MHMDKNIGGDSVEAFTPERRLADKQQAAEMAMHDRSTGYGGRVYVCEHITRSDM